MASSWLERPRWCPQVSLDVPTRGNHQPTPPSINRPSSLQFAWCYSPAGTLYSYASECPKVGFTVVPPPVGAVVPAPPGGATEETANGKTRTVDNGIHDRSVHDGSEVAYQGVADPEGS